MAEAARVLVVDDEPGICDLVSMALRYEGLKVEVAHTGRDALRSVASFRPHLVVLDVMLPDLDGFEVLRRLSGDHPRVPVLFLTARDALDDKFRGFTLGGDDYVTKPFSVEELIVRTRAILRRRPRDRGGQRDAALLGPRPRRGPPRGDPGWPGWSSSRPTEFKLLHYLLLEQRPGGLQGPDPRPGVAVRLRRQRERGRDLHQLAAAQAGGPRPPADPDRPRASATGSARPGRARGGRGRAGTARDPPGPPLAGPGGVVAAGLVISDVVVYAQLRSFLVARLDPELPARPTRCRGRSCCNERPGVAAAVRRAARSGPARGPRRRPDRHSAPTGPAVRPAPTARPAPSRRHGRRAGRAPAAVQGRPPALPLRRPGARPAGTAPAAADDRRRRRRLLRRLAAAGGPTVAYRVLVRPLGPQRPQRWWWPSPSPTPNQTLGRLAAGDGPGEPGRPDRAGRALAWWIVRRGLRPLEDMAVTAGAIAGGDLGAAGHPGRRRGPRWGGSAWPSTPCWGRSRRPSPPARRPRAASGGSWPTPPTSCAPRSPRSGATPRSSTWGPASGPRTWPPPCTTSARRPTG